MVTVSLCSCAFLEFQCKDSISGSLVDYLIEPIRSDFNLDCNIPRTPLKHKCDGQRSVTITLHHKQICTFAMSTLHLGVALQAYWK